MLGQANESTRSISIVASSYHNEEYLTWQRTEWSCRLDAHCHYRDIKPILCSRGSYRRPRGNRKWDSNHYCIRDIGWSSAKFCLLIWGRYFDGAAPFSSRRQDTITECFNCSISVSPSDIEEKLSKIPVSFRSPFSFQSSTMRYEYK